MTTMPENLYQKSILQFEGQQNKILLTNDNFPRHTLIHNLYSYMALQPSYSYSYNIKLHSQQAEVI
jgi:hypothetical protein